MSDFVTADQVFLDMPVCPKTDTLQFLSESAVELGLADDVAAVRAAYDAREEEGSTGMTDGMAVPHAKCAAIKRAAVIVIRFDGTVDDWETIDGSKVDLAISLLVPEAEAGSTHLQLLAKVARAMMDEAFRIGMREATDPAQVAQIINARLEA